MSDENIAEYMNIPTTGAVRTAAMSMPTAPIKTASMREDSMDVRYYDRQGQPLIGVAARAKAFEDPNYKRVALTILPNGVKISTVWLGLDHQWDVGPPLIFETMVFPDDKDFHEKERARYGTEAEAIAGHQVLCEKWMKDAAHD